MTEKPLQPSPTVTISAQPPTGAPGTQPYDPNSFYQYYGFDPSYYQYYAQNPYGYPGYPPGVAGGGFDPKGSLPPGFDPTSCRSLYVGNLSEKVTEGLLYEIFAAIGPVEACKLIKDKNSGQSAGYGFIDYFDHYTSGLALAQFNGRHLYGLELKVNWAFASGQKEDTSGHFHIFVGDLSPEIDDRALYNAFAPFGTISDGRVMWDQNTGRSRGYGFVAFRKREDAQRALTEMNGNQVLILISS